MNGLYQILAPRAGGCPQSEGVGADRETFGRAWGIPERKFSYPKISAQARERLAATAWAQPPQRGGMFAMGTVARSGTVRERGCRSVCTRRTGVTGDVKVTPKWGRRSG